VPGAASSKQVASMGAQVFYSPAPRLTCRSKIDIAPQNDDLFREFFQRRGVGRNVDLIVGDSQKTKYPQIGEIDVLFVDGEHSYDGGMNDMVNWYDHLVPNGHLIVHDCYLGQWAFRMPLPRPPFRTTGDTVTVNRAFLLALPGRFGCAFYEANEIGLTVVSAMSSSASRQRPAAALRRAPMAVLVSFA
jgi:Methyltransferase domain